MIEQMMILALGFFIAGLAAVAFAPIFWARAIRLSVRRLEMQLPLSMREILADRDQVRAESAVEQRRIEQKAEALNEAHIGHMAELGRRAVRITQMQEHIAGMREANAGLSLDLAKLTEAHTDLKAQSASLAAEFQDLSQRHAQETEKSQALNQAYNDLLALADEQKASIATLSACGAALEARLASTERALADTQTLLRNKEAEAGLLASHLARARDDIKASDTSRLLTLEKSEKQGLRLTELESQIKEAQGALDEGVSQHRTLTANLESHESELRAARNRGDELERKYESQAERARSVERGLIDRIERLRAENSALQGALGAARQECSALSQELSKRSAHGPVKGQMGGAQPASHVVSEDEASLTAHSA